MSDIVELERRITAALERIGRGVETMKAGAATASASDSEDMAAMQSALEDERVANRQLEERLKALKERNEELESRAEALRDAAERAEASASRLKAANERLRENNAALRAANAQGLGDGHLINKSMTEEITALRAARAADAAEVDAILDELKAAIGEGSHA